VAVPLHGEPGVTVPLLNSPATAEPASMSPAEDGTPHAEKNFQSEFEVLLQSEAAHLEATSTAAKGEDQEPDPEYDSPGSSLPAMLPVPVVAVPVAPKPPISLPEPAGAPEAEQESGASGARSAAAGSTVPAEPDEEFNFQALRVHARTRGSRQTELAFALRLREAPDQTGVRNTAPAAPIESQRVTAQGNVSAELPKGFPAELPAASPSSASGAPEEKSSDSTGPPEAKPACETRDERDDTPRRIPKHETAAFERDGVSTGGPGAAPASTPGTKPSEPVRVVVEAPLRTEAVAHPSPKPAQISSPAPDLNRIEPVPDEQARTEPVRDLTLNVPVEKNESGPERGVAVRFMERGGEVYVAVRTADTDLATRLRSDLNGLAASLDERGYQAESWRPAVNSGPSSGDERSPNHQGRSAGGGAQNGHSSHGDERGQSRNRPSWLEVLDQQEGEKA
jgi:hypothetical protein